MSLAFRTVLRLLGQRLPITQGASTWKITLRGLKAGKRRLMILRPMSSVLYRVLALLIAVGSGMFLRDPVPDVGPTQELALEASDPVDLAANSNRRRTSPTRLERASTEGDVSDLTLFGDDGNDEGWALPDPPRPPMPRALVPNAEFAARPGTNAAEKHASAAPRGPPALV